MSVSQHFRKRKPSNRTQDALNGALSSLELGQKKTIEKESQWMLPPTLRNIIPPTPAVSPLPPRSDRKKRKVAKVSDISFESVEKPSLKGVLHLVNLKSMKKASKGTKSSKKLSRVQGLSCTQIYSAFHVAAVHKAIAENKSKEKNSIENSVSLAV